MHDEKTYSNKVVITDSETRFDDIYNKPYVKPSILNDIKKANALILPNENFRGFTIPVFPEETSVFFEYLKLHSEGSDLVPDICIDDESYKVLELHADVLLLPLIFVAKEVLSIVVSIISSYLYDKFKQKRENFDMEIKITVQDNNSSKSLEYKGSASDFKKCFEETTNELFKLDTKNDETK